jgi:hypothetical protein
MLQPKCVIPKRRDLLANTARRHGPSGLGGGGGGLWGRWVDAGGLGRLGRIPGEDSKEKLIFKFQMN